MPAQLRSILTLGLADFLPALEARLAGIEAGIRESAADNAAGRRRAEERVDRLEADIAQLKALMAAQGEHQQKKLRASLSSLSNLTAALQHLKIDGVLPPFSHLGWEITGELAAFLVHLIRRQRPKLIFELGSGSSTFLFAAAARANGTGRVISVEHDPEHRGRTAQFLKNAELSDWVTLVETPLKEQSFGDRRMQWYDLQPLLRGLTESIDFLFVDGPPGRIQPLSRYPALPVLAPYFAETATVLVDDGRRDDEIKMVELWRELDISFDLEPLAFLPRSPFLLTLPASANRIAELRREHEGARAVGYDDMDSPADRRGNLWHSG